MNKNEFMAEAAAAAASRWEKKAKKFYFRRGGGGRKNCRGPWAPIVGLAARWTVSEIASKINAGSYDPVLGDYGYGA
jgi:hypothetical protein